MATRPGLILLLLLLALPGCGTLDALWPAEAPEPAAEAGPTPVLTAPRRLVLAPAGGAGAQRLWRGEGGVALATEGARVVAVAGLGPLLLATRFDTPDPLADPRALIAREARARRSVDLSGPDRDPASLRFGVALDCTLSGREEAGWIIVEERCAGEGLSFANRFWAEPSSGRVARSEQWAGGAIAVTMPGS